MRIVHYMLSREVFSKRQVKTARASKQPYKIQPIYGSSSPRWTLTSSLVQARVCGMEVGKLNVYGRS